MELYESLSAVGFYVIGSFPTAYIFGYLKKKTDIRYLGTRNMGTLNAFKSLGPLYGIATFILDFLKGFLPLWMVKQADFSVVALSVCTVAVIAGHDWSLFLGFKGGKGGATSSGVLLALFPDLFWFLLFIFFVISFLFGNVSLGIGISLGLLPIFVFHYIPYHSFFIPSLLIPVIGWVRLLPNFVLMLQKSKGNFKEMLYITFQGFFQFENKRKTSVD